MKRKYHLPLPQITTHPNSNIGTCLIPRKAVSGLHTQPEPLASPVNRSNRYDLRFSIRLNEIEIRTELRLDIHPSCIPSSQWEVQQVQNLLPTNHLQK